MTNQLNLEALEKKAYQSTFEDGILDIFFGLLLMSGGFSQILLNIGIPSPLNSLILMLFIVLIFFTGKKFITIPRIGRVKFGPKRQAAKKKLRVIAIGFTSGTWIFALLSITEYINISFDGLSSALVELLLLTLPLSLMAYFMDFNRLYVYAVLFGMAYPLSEFLTPHIGSPLDRIFAFDIPGGIIVIIGLMFLIQFLRKYPPINTLEDPSSINEKDTI